MSRRIPSLLVGALLVLTACTTGAQVDHVSGSGGGSVPGAAALDAFGDMPLAFVPNRGQSDSKVEYLAQGGRFGFFITSDALVMSLLQPDGERGVNLSLDFVDANPEVRVGGFEKTPGLVSYLKGEEPSDWHTGLSGFGEVVYEDLWSGVDMSLRGDGGVLKYEFRVQPGAEVEDIRLAYRGAEALTADGNGGLLVDTSIGSLEDSPPVSYQVVDGERVPVESRYLLDESGMSYGFGVAGYDPTRELIIDPGLSYATFLGGFGNQVGEAIAVDDDGNAYVTGFTQSPDFPTTPGAFDRSGSAQNNLDVFVTKLNPSGTGLVYSTFLGGSNFEFGRDVAIDGDGSAYIVGQTKSSNFPTRNAFQGDIAVDDCPRCGVDPDWDGFVTKLNSSGSGLVYSTYLGGFGFDDITSIAVDDRERAYVGGETWSPSSFPTEAGSFDTTENGGIEAFVAKFNRGGSSLDFSTFLGGADLDRVSDIAVNSSRNAVVVGSTRSADFPTTSGVVQPADPGGSDGFVTRLNTSGSDLVFSSFLGGSDSDSAGDIELDASGNLYLAGFSSSADFPTTSGTFDPNGSGSFVAKLNSTASAFIWSTFVPGASAIAVDSDGSVWLAGGTSSPTAFVTSDAWDPQLAGSASDIYLAKLTPTAAELEYATYLGGTGSDLALDVALDPDGNVYFTGRTRSEDFPITAGAADTTFGANAFIGGWDGFVAMFEVGPNAPEPPPPSPPIPGGVTLVSPAEDASVGVPVTFDWDDTPAAASYEIQIDEIDVFGLPLILSEEVTTSEFTASDLPAGDWNWFWRVRAVNSEGTPGPWSEGRAFNKQDGPIAPGPEAPSLILPADGAQVDGVSVIFEWTRVAGAAWHVLEFDDEPTFSSPLLFDSFSTGTKTLMNLPDGELFWRVRAFNSAGAAGAYSEVRSVEVGGTTTTSSTSTTTTTLPPTTTTTTAPPPTTTTTTAPTTTTTTTAPPSGPLPAPALFNPSDDEEYEPGSTITFDWGNVNGAVAYTIHIDDDDDFSSPFVVNETVSVSQLVVSGLDEERFWYRVRAVDGNGTPGDWSEERRFELKD